MSGFQFCTFTGWNARPILRTVERGSDETADALRQAIVDNPAVRGEAIEACAAVNADPYRPGLYRTWLYFACQHEGPG